MEEVEAQEPEVCRMSYTLNHPQSSAFSDLGLCSIADWGASLTSLTAKVHAELITSLFESRSENSDGPEPRDLSNAYAGQGRTLYAYCAMTTFIEVCKSVVSVQI